MLRDEHLSGVKFLARSLSGEFPSLCPGCQNPAPKSPASLTSPLCVCVHVSGGLAQLTGTPRSPFRLDVQGLAVTVWGTLQC